MSTQRTVFATILGQPNAGKSTLTNRIVGTKVSIVTPKVQTTRARMTGIAMQGDVQLVLIDTPGIFTPQKALDKAMVKAAWNEAGEADVSIVLVDAKKCQGELDDGTKTIIKGVASRGGRAVLALNKVDLVKDKAKLLALSQQCYGLCDFAQSFMISAEKGDGVNDLITYLCEQSTEESWPYDPEEVSTISSRLFAAEVTREQLMLALDHELPYELMVETEAWEEGKNGITIRQVIYVMKEGQKRILVGKGGSKIKQVGEQARKALSYHLGTKVHVFLFVKVDEKWQERTESYRVMGFDV